MTSGVCLIVLDGWGLAPPGPGNAISLARTPCFDELWASYPHTQLAACGGAVGLPDGQMGNSEVGHLNLGAGTVMRQDLTRIDAAIADGSLARNEVLRAAFDGNGRVHLIGLVSDGGVHSSLEHLEALIALVDDPARVLVHAWTDGRDTLPTSGAEFVARIERRARIGSVAGRYWTMDRDARWERTQRAYDLLVQGRGAFAAATGEQAVLDAYARGETDEFIEPTVVGAPGASRIQPGDSVICFNFRPDRMRQIVRSLAEPELAEVDRRDGARVSQLVTLTEYEEGWPYPVAFVPARPEVTLSLLVARSGARQLHVAETEKYPHVTYFFNGGEERPLERERRELVPSPRDVPTYDLRPSMSAREAAAAFCAAWRSDAPRFGIINFANADMVGHTGVIPAAVAAVETVDDCLREVVEVVNASGGECVICADHGNSDHMLEPDGSPNTAHSLNPVPLIVTRRGLELLSGGALADVAPTVLELLKLEQPAAMRGRSLIA